MGNEPTFVETLGRASLDELETLWKEALREFMAQIGVPDQVAAAEALVLADPAWTGLAADWITLPSAARQTRYGQILELVQKSGYSTRPFCLRCGACCRRSSPTLFTDDLRLFAEGVITRADAYTLRRGEVVSLPEGLGTLILEAENIKLREDPETGACMFYDAVANSCGIYKERPLQCRAQACWDTEYLVEALTKEERLGRTHVVSPQEPVADAILAHEGHCALPPLAEAFRAISDGSEDALDQVFSALAYDAQLRPLLVEKLPLPAEELDFLFGRPMRTVIQMFGVRVEDDPDGGYRLVSLAPGDPEPGV